MTVDIKEYDELKKRFFEDFAKEYNIKLNKLTEGDEQPQEDGSQEAQPESEPKVITVTDEPTPVIPAPADIAQGVAEDTSLQDEPLKAEGSASIKFEQGNYNQLQDSVRALVKKPGIISRTFLPLVEKALIELLGTSSSYKRSNFEFNISLVNGQIKYIITCIYSVDLFIGTDIEKSAVEHDQNYIIETISVVPEIKVRDVKIDTSTGLVRIQVII